MSVAVLAVVIATVGYLLLGRESSATARATTATSATGTYQQTVGGTGTIEPARQADLDFAVSGRVTSVDVEAGDAVKKGEVLAKLDTVSLDAALTSAKAQLEAAETTAANDASETSTQRASHDAALASAQADVAQAEDDLDAATLKATFTGTVAAVSVAVGDQAGSSASTGTGTGAGQSGTTGGAATSTAISTTTAAITVVKASTFVVDVDVAAADITKVKKGL